MKGSGIRHGPGRVGRILKAEIREKGNPGRGNNEPIAQKWERAGGQGGVYPAGTW